MNFDVKEKSLDEALVVSGLSVEDVKPRFADFLDKAVLFQRSAEALEVHDDETREQAANLAGGAKKLVKAIETRRKEVIAPAQEFVKGVNGLVGKITLLLEQAAALVGQKEMAFLNLLEMKRREVERLAQEAVARLQKQVDREAKKKGIEPIKIEAPVVPEVQTTARTESGISSYTVTTWDFEIQAEAEVPRDYCSSDSRKIRDGIKNGVRQIPGVRIFEKTEIRHRS